jgi:ankyrin repeat protein
VSGVQYGYAPLHLAAMEGHTASVKVLLLATGVDVNIKDEVCTHPCRPALPLSPCLPRVCGRGTVVEEAVRWYATHPAPTDGGCVCGVQDGSTPLRLASNKGHTAIVELLKAAEAKVLRGGPLHVAAEDGDKATVEELLAAAGVDVNVQKKVRKFLPPLRAPLSPCLSRVCVRARHGGGGGRQVVRGSHVTH